MSTLRGWLDAATQAIAYNEALAYVLVKAANATEAVAWLVARALLPALEHVLGQPLTVLADVDGRCSGRALGASVRPAG